MKKATHTGECQLCGKSQKLPNQRLSLHGYSVQWNMFNNTCPGSHGLPYQQSCKLIKEVILNCDTTIAKIKEEIESIRLRYGVVAFVQSWKPAQGSQRGSYQWVEISVEMNERSAKGWATAKGFKAVDYALKDKSLEDIAAILNEEYINRVLMPQLNQWQNYQSWCADRVTNWTLQELKEVVHA